MPITRRQFLQTTAAAALMPARRASAAGETLYNGIVLPQVWPPRRRVPDAHPFAAPYLHDPPSVIPIDVGRQLFVDDFLIQETSLTRTFHLATYHQASPVLRPETWIELDDEYAARTNTPANPTAMVFSDGVFYDPRDQLFKMWYMAGYRRHTGLAYSRDGVTWQRPALDFWEGTNIVQRGGRDSGTVWLDAFATDPAARFKMALFHDTTLSLHTSPDGIHWKRFGETGPSGDRTTFFYNPFRHVWVFGVRADLAPGRGRYRRYWEHPRFEAAAEWSGIEAVPWVRADERDAARPDMASAAELYNLDCVAYESVLIGLFNVWRGENPRREKINEVALGYSRDGFHWTRPDRRAFLGVSDVPGAWNHANVQSAGACCLVVGDLLYFYMSGRTGIPGTDLPGTCSTGLATLRRDGFASLDWLPDGRAPRRISNPRGTGDVVTRPVRFRGAHLFVNAALDTGELRAEVLDVQGNVIPGFELERCVPARGDGTRLPVAWTGASLSRVAGTPVRLRFEMTRGRFYAFWVSEFATGESGGFVAGGGPGFPGPADVRTSA